MSFYLILWLEFYVYDKYVRVTALKTVHIWTSTVVVCDGNEDDNCQQDRPTHGITDVFFGCLKISTKKRVP